MSAVNASRSATAALTWQECVLRFPIVTTKWSSAMNVLRGDAAHEAMPPRGFGAVLIDARPEGPTDAAITIHVQQPDATVRVAASLHARVDVTADSHGMLHLDFIDIDHTGTRVMTVSVDAEAPHALHYAQTTLLQHIGLPAGSTDAPLMESFVGAMSSEA